jgi:hypothetical protein
MERTTLKGIRGLASYLGISTATAQRLKNENKVPYFMIYSRVYFEPEHVDQTIRGKLTNNGEDGKC